MKTKLILTLSALMFIISGYSQSPLLMLDATNTPVPSNALQDDDGNIQIGNTTISQNPACPNPAYLKIVQPTMVGSECDGVPDLFRVEHALGAFNSDVPTPHFIPTGEYMNDMVVTGDGNTGIGTATPFQNATLTVKGREWYTGNGDFGKMIQVYEDPDNNILGGFANSGAGTPNSGGSFLIMAANGTENPAFMVLNQGDGNGKVPFAVMPDGTIGTGIDVNGSGIVEAQVNIHNTHVKDYILQIKQDITTDYPTEIDYFNIAKNGQIGIGMNAWSGEATVNIKSMGNGIADKNKIDLFSSPSATSGWENVIRFRNSTGTVRHLVMDDLDHNTFTIVPRADIFFGTGGAYGTPGGNVGKLLLLGDEEVTGTLTTKDLNVTQDIEARDLKARRNLYVVGQAGIGIDPTQAGGSTLAVKGTSSTSLSLIGSSTSTSSGWNSQLWFKDNSGADRHVIMDDLDHNTLSIWPRYDLQGGGANGKLLVIGDEEVTGQGTIDGGLKVSNWLTVDGPGQTNINSSKLVVMNGTDLKSTLTVGGAVDFNGYLFETSANTYVHALGDATFDGAKAEIGTSTWFHAKGDANFSGAKLEVDQNTWFHAKGDASFDSKVKIGNVTAPDGYMLFVEKGILTEKVKVALKAGDWSDYVFDKNYKLLTLDSVSNFIAKNNHLPEVPSSSEVEKNGVDIGKMNATLLRKIEELTLYVLALKQENKEVRELVQNKK